MKKHTETLIKIRAYKSALADRLISAWGTARFVMVIDEIQKHHQELAGTMTGQLAAIKADHLAQYPAAGLAWIEHLPQELANNQEFKLIAAGFPHIGRRLAAHWGTRKGLEYLESLFIDDRDGKRRGFPYETYMSLVKLQEMHHLVYPDLKKASADPWELL